MKIGRLVNEKILVTFLCSMISLLTLSSVLSHVDINNALVKASITEAKAEEVTIDMISDYQKNSALTERKVVYDNKTMEELGAQINKSLNSYISGKGDLIASYSLEKGVDPYLATGIILLETGCSWTCSKLTTQCNNVGGQKGSPACMGSYRGYNTLDEGIMGFIDNLSINYYQVGLDTPEKMNSKYAESGMWAIKVRNYMSSIASK